MPKPLLVNVAVLRDYMSRERETQKSLAAKLGITPEHFGRVLKQQTSPSLDLLYAMEEVTGIPWWTFMVPPDMALVPRKEQEAIDRLRELLGPQAQLATAV